MSEVTLSIDGRDIRAEAGAPLVEVIKRAGIWISNLCYIDGLPPYAGCRTCLVEIEGARGLQLACTTAVREGMVVRTWSDEIKAARQAVVSLINANHPDRCLTCHRRVKCMPGDICLRDDVVTHRCLTCAKNYRCELQDTNILLGMGDDSVEPWEGENRTYYHGPIPEPDRANPWLEFDPQMCIICTRCVRACDDIRQTGAITLAGRGYTTRIAFGSGGAVHESNCDFCGACIDVCPTATLLEKPNKWIARTEDWTPTVCNSCSVGCTLSVGARQGRAVMVKPDRLNPVSFDQICVRGRFHYDAISHRERLTRHLVRKGDTLVPASFEEAAGTLIDRLQDIVKRHGAESVAFLGSPFLTTEENYLTQKLAREVIGTPHVDSSHGPLNRAVARALRDAFGTDALPASMEGLDRAAAIVVIADDLESSHNVAALRVKQAVRQNGGRLALVSPHWGELADFTEPYGGVWLRPAPGAEAAAVAALAAAIAKQRAAEGGSQAYTGVEGDLTAAPAVDVPELEKAAALLAQVASDPNADVRVLYAPNPVGADAAAEGARAAANLAMALRGADAPRCLVVLPTEANVNGMRDAGVEPEGGLPFEEMIAAVERGALKAMVAVGDNPLMSAPDSARVRAALSKLELLAVVDGTLTDTAKLAHVVLADAPTYAKDGVFVNAERRVSRLRPAIEPDGDARPALDLLLLLAKRLNAGWTFESAADVMEELASRVPRYAAARYGEETRWGKVRVIEEPSRCVAQPVASPSAPGGAKGALVLFTARTLYTSWEGASIHSPEADKLHREEFVQMNPADAVELGVSQGDEVALRNGDAELVMRVEVTNAVPRGTVFVPWYYDGGAVAALFTGDTARTGLAPVAVGVRERV
ncbi:MAG TPA: molybdopterin-dependent oxidoreductase [Dehalococcoidia bacterium]|nr:molybdopterin-dependent oxidoreductase [Dehalococcoidia bacterium]